MIHVGVDLHQRFCYMTALEARGKILRTGVQPGPFCMKKVSKAVSSVAGDGGAGRVHWEDAGRVVRKIVQVMSKNVIRFIDSSGMARQSPILDSGTC